MELDKLRAKVNPDSTALIVIDMQKDYCCEGGVFHGRGFDLGPTQKLVERLTLFLPKARKVLRQIIHLKMTKVPGLASAAAAELYGRHGVQRTYDPAYAEFHVVPDERDTVIAKYRYSGFFSTYLDQFLRSNGIKTVILTGVSTNVCVESTARDAFMRDYFVVVPRDLTEGSTAEAGAASLATIDLFIGQVVSSGDLLQCWGLQA